MLCATFSDFIESRRLNLPQPTTTDPSPSTSHWVSPAVHPFLDVVKQCARLPHRALARKVMTREDLRTALHWLVEDGDPVMDLRQVRVHGRQWWQQHSQFVLEIA